MKENEQTEYFHGARVALAAMGLDYGNKRHQAALQWVIDIAELDRLNARHSSAWVRGNNSGNNRTKQICDAIEEKCLTRARAICKARRWSLDTGAGLYWSARTAGGIVLLGS